jgi:hypothetical protein
MDDKDRLDLTDSFVRYDYLTSTVELIETLSRIERDIEESETSGATSATMTRVSWMRRVLGRFRRG